ncbi:hypothetical protein Sps_02645 [Shewanella psychrophila]|uniref:Uncharacterized protein n=1 Tax=Shewanella psychrophila TaxID=225848 RepID=A0A1S6HQH4_9GAMM|nr:GNAT family N-acetyltransferase [Shewanella psychrophila]AQS37797.1 hypothetical protein Sps_02645 [Shewanella psychrophila]
MNIRPAHIGDLEQLIELEKLHLNDELNDGSKAKTLDGQAFGKAELKELIENHWICIAEKNMAKDSSTETREIIGYVIAGRWTFFEAWPVYRRILKGLKELNVDGSQLSKGNSCQYGPIWIKKECRGQGIFEALVNGIKAQVKNEFSFMLTFIAEDNLASFTAHTKKASMVVLDYFTFDDRDYYLLALST